MSASKATIVGVSGLILVTVGLAAHGLVDLTERYIDWRKARARARVETRETKELKKKSGIIVGKSSIGESKENNLMNPRQFMESNLLYGTISCKYGNQDRELKIVRFGRKDESFIAIIDDFLPADKCRSIIAGIKEEKLTVANDTGLNGKRVSSRDHVTYKVGGFRDDEVHTLISCFMPSSDETPTIPTELLKDPGSKTDSLADTTPSNTVVSLCDKCIVEQDSDGVAIPAKRLKDNFNIRVKQYDASRSDKLGTFIHMDINETTIIVYLNNLDQDAGGETEFINLGLTVEPRMGRAVVFQSYKKISEDRWKKDWNLEHRGNPLRSGKKYILQAQSYGLKDL